MTQVAGIGRPLPRLLLGTRALGPGGRGLDPRMPGGRAVPDLGWRDAALSDFEFAAASEDGHGVDWPVRHHNLAPYYSRVEELLVFEGTATVFASSRTVASARQLRSHPPISGCEQRSCAMR